MSALASSSRRSTSSSARRALSGPRASVPGDGLAEREPGRGRGFWPVLEPEDETLKGIYPRLVTAKNRFAGVVVLAGPRC